MSMRASAMMSKLAPSLASGLPKASRRSAALAHQLERPLGLADGAHAVVDAARAEPALRDLEAPALAEQRLEAGTRTLVKRMCKWPCGASSSP
jgi:hypothetical protein